LKEEFVRKLVEKLNKSIPPASWRFDFAPEGLIL